MGEFTVRLSDEKHRRLLALAQYRGTTVERLIDEMTTDILADVDTETRFILRAGRGTECRRRGLALLAKARLDE